HAACQQPGIGFKDTRLPILDEIRLEDDATAGNGHMRTKMLELTFQKCEQVGVVALGAADVNGAEPRRLPKRSEATNNEIAKSAFDRLEQAGPRWIFGLRRR